MASSLALMQRIGIWKLFAQLHVSLAKSLRAVLHGQDCGSLQTFEIVEACIHDTQPLGAGDSYQAARG